MKEFLSEEKLSEKLRFTRFPGKFPVFGVVTLLPGGNEQSGCVVVNVFIQSMLSLRMNVCKSKNILNELFYIQS